MNNVDILTRVGCCEGSAVCSVERRLILRGAVKRLVGMKLKCEHLNQFPKIVDRCQFLLDHRLKLGAGLKLEKFRRLDGGSSVGF